MGNEENVIEFLKGQDRATASFSQGRYITRIKKLAETWPDQVDYIQNPDGTICAHFPVSWIRIAHPTKLELSEGEKERRRELLRNSRNRNKTD